MTNSLDLEHLRTLVAIADFGGFSKAATIRHISQPGLSQHIRLLESRLDRKLFEKDGRQARLTRDGEQTLAEARHILAVHDLALQRLAAADRSVLTVGLDEHIAGRLLSKILEVVNTMRPETVVHFEVGRASQLSDSVAGNDVDLALVLDPAGENPGHSLGTLPLQWYARPGWVSVSGDPSRLVAFARPDGLRDRALTLLAREDHDIEIATESSTLEGVLAGARAGLGVALLPSLGPPPSGLSTPTDFPPPGLAGVRLISARDVDLELRQLVADAGSYFIS